MGTSLHDKKKLEHHQKMFLRSAPYAVSILLFKEKSERTYRPVVPVYGLPSWDFSSRTGIFPHKKKKKKKKKHAQQVEDD